MGRYIGAVCRFCKREGEKLFLKGDRCYTAKCAIDENKKQPPGQHTQRKGKLSDYALQLREKQKVKRSYGLLEKQFRKYFKEAEKKKGITGEQLLQSLELRLDNIVFRMGFASNRNQARQLVNHGHLTVNGKRVDIPSYRTKPGDTVEVRQKSQKIPSISENIARTEHAKSPQWLDVEHSQFKGKVMNVPARDDIAISAKEQLIVELYSK
ncbi:30S ribosomal protein S4 [Candidatus Magnetoovum chiemensis]|nr:30S ribosomal protein S4 [Candidatus Magnetoovum chiemensis]